MQHKQGRQQSAKCKQKIKAERRRREGEEMEINQERREAGLLHFMPRTWASGSS